MPRDKKNQKTFNKQPFKLRIGGFKKMNTSFKWIATFHKTAKQLYNGDYWGT